MKRIKIEKKITPEKEVIDRRTDAEKKYDDFLKSKDRIQED